MASAMMMKSQKPASATACLRCGKEGHWARDCPEANANANANNGTDGPPRGPAPEGGREGGREREAGRLGGDGGEDAKRRLADDDLGAANDEPAKKKRARRPTLNVEKLTNAAGIPWVYTHVPESFRKQYKGGDHLIGDLKRFLQMYEVWQRRVFPQVSHEEFVEKVEGLGSKGPVQLALKTLRREAMRTAERGEFGEDDEDEDGAFDWAVGGLVGRALLPAPAGGEREGEGEGAPGGAAADDDDDDDYDRLMKEPARAASAEGGGDDGDDQPPDDEEDLPDDLFMDDES